MDLQNETFYKILDKIKIDYEDSNIEQIVFVSRFDCYELNTYINVDEDESLNFYIKEYGTMVFGKWNDLTYNDYQYSLIESKCKKLAKEFLKEKEEEARREFEEQNEEPNGGIDEFYFWNNIYN